jgi:hypothetical protein
MPYQVQGVRSMNSSEITALIKARAAKAAGTNMAPRKIQDSSEVTARVRKHASRVLAPQYNFYNKNSVSSVTGYVAGNAYNGAVANQQRKVFGVNPACALSNGRPIDMPAISVQTAIPCSRPIDEHINVVRTYIPKGTTPLAFQADPNLRVPPAVTVKCTTLPEVLRG